MTELHLSRWLPMTAALAIAFGYFGWVMYGKTRLVLAGRWRPEFATEIPKRIGMVLTYFLGQKKLFKELRPGVMHAVIFWGFLVLLVRSLYLIFYAYDDDLVMLPAYAFFKDLTELVVLVMLGYAVYRRLVVKPARLHLSAEALVVLGMIAGLMVSDFLYDGFHFAWAEKMGEFAVYPALAAERDAAFVGSGLASLFSGIELASLAAGQETFYWLHIFILLTFLNLLPGSKHFHVITAVFNVFFGETKARGAIRAIEDIEEQEVFGVGDVTLFDTRQLLDLYTCTECGRCSVNCPTTISGKVLNPICCARGSKSGASRAHACCGRGRWGAWTHVPFGGP